MKTLLLSTLFVASAYHAQSQTKGTNGVGFGVSIQSFKSEDYLSASEQKLKNYSLSYTNFIKDNVRIGVTGNYIYSKFGYDGNSTTLSKGYGGSLNYKKYYPLLKKFYAFAGANSGYLYQTHASSGSSYQFNSRENQVNVSGSGGAACFISKRFLFEATLISGGMHYSKQTSNNGGVESTQSYFNFSSSGAITNLGFQIYFLF